MEPAFDLLEHLLSDEDLNNQIRTCTSVKTFNCLLQEKHRRVKNGHCEKLDFSIKCIYESCANVDLGTQILETTLLVALDTNTHMVQAIKYVLDKLSSSHNVDELYYALNLFNVILESHKNEQINLPEIDVNDFHNGVLKVLKGSSKRLITFTLIYIFPNYLSVSDKDTKDKFLARVFEFITETKKLEVLCICYDHFFKSDLNNDDFNLIKTDAFWLLLTDCLVNQHYFMRKQAIYLLSKSIEIVLTKHNLPYLPSQLQAANSNEIEKIWKNYLTLLDVSNEKQLHIVEPSLCLFSSIKDLQFLWRVSLYKIFLNHSQNSVVYKVANFILQTEREWQYFSKIIKDLLQSVNKNEYSPDSTRIFKEIGNYCNILDNNQFGIFLQDSLNVPWVPAAIWHFYSSIFNTPRNFQISSIVESIIKRLKLIPNKFIRNGCTKIILNYFTRNCTVESLNLLLKISVLLQNFEEILFESFITSNQKRIRSFSNELRNQFLASLTDDGENLQDFEIKIKILQFLDVTLPKSKVYSSKTDLLHLLLFDQDSEQIDLEIYLINRIDLLQESEDITALIRLSQAFCSVKLLEKASNILLEDDLSKFSNTQRVIAFQIFSRHGTENAKVVIDFWKNHFLKTTEYIDERISRCFVETLLNNLAKFNTVGEVEEAVTILDNIIDAKSDATITILANLSHILKNIEQGIVRQFIGRCFEEFLTLTKSGSSKTTSNIFLSQIFEPNLLQNDEFSEQLVIFCQKLVNISNSSNSIAYIVSKKLALSIEQIPQKGFLFIPIIIELILRGVIVNKNERVEYHVCQEISLKLATENNPNFEEMSARLWALESMLNLVEHSSENTNRFVELLMEKYLKYLSKRYFPDSQIHLEKLRILQTLMLLQKYIIEKSKLVDFLTESFVMESHQPSVKHLMQWLLISLVKNDSKPFVEDVAQKLTTIDNNRPSTVSGLIPILYHLVAAQEESQWDSVVSVLVPYAMGAQFKLRIFSQVALVKLYEDATQMQYCRFVSKYKFLYDSLKLVVEATGNANFDVSAIHHDFLDYFSLENCDCSTIFYTIPKNNGVTEIEWENLSRVSARKQFQHLNFNHNDFGAKNDFVNEVPTTHNANIQKKITPWKDILNNSEHCKYTNNFMLVTSLIEKPANLGGLSRTCEVFGIKQMVMRTSKITADKEFKSLSMSSENWMDIMEVKIEELQTFIMSVKKQGFTVIGAEQTSESVKLDEFEFPKMTVLVLGNEKEGISPELIPLLDKCIEIPQFGMVRSLNVHVAGAIVIWEYCKQHKL